MPLPFELNTYDRTKIVEVRRREENVLVVTLPKGVLSPDRVKEVMTLVAETLKKELEELHPYVQPLKSK